MTETFEDRIKRLTDSYIRDLEIEVATINERPEERSNPEMVAYRDKCAAEIAALRGAGERVRIDRYGIPHPISEKHSFPL